MSGAISYQGTSDHVAATYIERHGTISAWELRCRLNRRQLCPKLKDYWHYKNAATRRPGGLATSRRNIPATPCSATTCAMAVSTRPYSLFLFVRDVSGGDLVGWIDRQLKLADQPKSTMSPSCCVTLRWARCCMCMACPIKSCIRHWGACCWRTAGIPMNYRTAGNASPLRLLSRSRLRSDHKSGVKPHRCTGVQSGNPSVLRPLCANSPASTNARATIPKPKRPLENRVAAPAKQGTGPGEATKLAHAHV